MLAVCARDIRLLQLAAQVLKSDWIVKEAFRKRRIRCNWTAKVICAADLCKYLHDFSLRKFTIGQFKRNFELCSLSQAGIIELNGIICLP